MSILLAVAACGVGFFIGAVGVGGVLLIPPLTWIARMSIHEAAATALFTFVFTGVAGTWLFQQRGSIDWRVTAWVCGGAVVFSYLGAWVNSIISAHALDLIVAFIIVLAGAYVLLSRRHPAEVRQAPHNTRKTTLLLAIGAVSGFGSGLSGAGGPLFSVPIMLVFGFAPLTAIGAGQVLQIIAASFGSLGNLQYGTINYAYAAVLTLCELAGLYLGVRVAHRAKVGHLRALAAWLCIVVGSGMLLSATRAGGALHGL